MIKVFTKLTLFAFFILGINCSETSDYFSEEGYVLDSQNNSPIVGADVLIAASTNSSNTITDENGYFEIYVSTYPNESEAAVLTIKKDGYKEFRKTISAFVTTNTENFLLERN